MTDFEREILQEQLQLNEADYKEGKITAEQYEANKKVFSDALNETNGTAAPETPPAASPPAAAPPPPPEIPKIHLNVNGQNLGSFDRDAVIEKIRSGEINRDAMIWKKGMDNWVKAGDAPELENYFPEQPPPMPAISTAAETAPPPLSVASPPPATAGYQPEMVAPVPDFAAEEKRKAEEAAKRRAEEEAARRRVEEEAVKRKTEEEAAAKRRIEQEAEAAKKRKTQQESEIVMLSNKPPELLEAKEKLRLAEYYESVGDYKKSALYYDEIVYYPSSIYFTKAMLKVAEYYAKGLSKHDYATVKEMLKDAINRDSGQLVVRLQEKLKQHKK